MQQRDPFSWAEDYARNQNAMAAQENGDAQQMLMGIFQQEAARQRPFNDLPVDLARQNNAADQAFKRQSAMVDYKNANKPMVPPTKVASAITSAARAYGIDSDMMLSIAEKESGFKNVGNRQGSGASGIFQFMPGTAAEYGLADPFDVNANIDAAMRLTKNNMNALERAGIPVNAGTIYLAHQQGAGGAIKLLSNPDAPAESIVGAKAVRMNGGRPGMSAGQFANLWMSQINKNYEQRKALRNQNQNKQNPNEAFGKEIKISLDE